MGSQVVGSQVKFGEGIPMMPVWLQKSLLQRGFGKREVRKIATHSLKATTNMALLGLSGTWVSRLSRYQKCFTLQGMSKLFRSARFGRRARFPLGLAHGRWFFWWFPTF
eukprot:3804439-Amphidinium_carterae.1